MPYFDEEMNVSAGDLALAKTSEHRFRKRAFVFTAALVVSLLVVGMTGIARPSNTLFLFSRSLKGDDGDVDVDVDASGSGKGSSKGSSKGSGKGSSKGSSKGSGKGSGKGSSKGSSKGCRKKRDAFLFSRSLSLSRSLKGDDDVESEASGSDAFLFSRNLKGDDDVADSGCD
jgi:hypothetical protein